MTKRKDLVDAEVVEAENAITRTQEPVEAQPADGPAAGADVVEGEAEFFVDPRVEGLARTLHAVYIKRLSVRSRPSVALHYDHLNTEERASWEAVAGYIING